MPGFPDFGTPLSKMTKTAKTGQNGKNRLYYVFIWMGIIMYMRINPLSPTPFTHNHHKSPYIKNRASNKHIIFT